MKAILVIPGYKGSYLKDPTKGGRVWLRLGTLFQNAGSLSLPIGEASEKQDHLIEDGLLKGFRLSPGYRLMDVYQSFVEHLQKSSRGDFSVSIFSYDWRQSLPANAKKLDECITALKNRGMTDIRVISHSMGGCILLYYLRYGIQDPENAVENWQGVEGISKTLFCAVPFMGAIRSLIYTHIGNPVLFNKRILSSATALTFPSAYQMLPSYDEKAVKYIDSDDQIRIFSAESWEQNKLGFFGNPDTEGKRPVQREFTAKMLHAGETISKLLSKPPVSSPSGSCSMLNVYSGSEHTYTKLYLKKTSAAPVLITNKNIHTYSNGPLPEMESAGDGLVCEKSGHHPLAGLLENCEEIKMSFGHKKVFNDKAARKVILDFVLA
jgi:hypothetical protein